MDAWWAKDAVVPRTIFEAGRERIVELKLLDLVVANAKRDLDDCTIRLEAAMKVESGEIDPHSGYLRGAHPDHATVRETLDAEWAKRKREWQRRQEQRKVLADDIRRTYVRVRIDRLDLDAPSV